jgi:hypothetical protein
VESASSRHHTKDSSALACDRRRPTAAVAVSQGAQAKRYLRFPYGSGHGLSLLFTRAVPTQQLRYVSAAAAKRDGQRRLAFGRSGVQVDVGGEKRLDHVALAGFGRPHQRRVFATNLRRVRRGRGFSQESKPASTAAIWPRSRPARPGWASRLSASWRKCWRSSRRNCCGPLCVGSGGSRGAPRYARPSAPAPCSTSNVNHRPTLGHGTDSGLTLS